MVMGTMGRLIAVALFDGFEGGRGGRRVQCEARTSECVGYRGAVAEEACICCAANDEAVGVAGVEAEDFEEETAKRWVGNAEDSGALDDGLTGASREEGKRDLGSELGIESKFTAASILDGKKLDISSAQTILILTR
jgi:hypothetical protein